MKMEFQNKRVLVIGAGLSGKSATRLLLKLGAQVTVTDSKPISRPSTNELEGDFAWRCGDQDSVIEQTWDFIVISPGVPPNLPALDGARNRGSVVIGEVELAYNFIKRPIMAITGTNGKSTTTKLAGDMMKAAGLKPFVGGNIGLPLSELALAPDDYDYAVLELSSFQLETLVNFEVDIAVLLNIAPDHLDRYADMESYAEAKSQLFWRVKTSGAIIFPEKCDFRELLLEGAEEKVYTFSPEDKGVSGAFRQSYDSFGIRRDMDKFAYTVGSPSLGGDYNLENAMAAALAAKLAGANDDAIQDALNSFVGLPHRRELIVEFGDVDFYNDSKATNVHAAAATLKSFPAMDNIILIVGGLLKESDLDSLGAAGAERVKYVLGIGRDGQKLLDAFGDVAKNEYVETMENAVMRAFETARQGDIVLLSPATASFDAYKNYSERGHHFATLVKQRARPITNKLSVVKSKDSDE